MKISKGFIGAFFIVVAILLFFFSKTMYTYNLPLVTGTKPFRGSLDKLEISSGTAEYGEPDTIYAAVSGTVGTVYVKAGDNVVKGQELFLMDYKADTVERKIKGLENDIEKLRLDIRNSEIKLERLSDQAKLETGVAEAALKEAEWSFEYGRISQNALLSAQNNVESLSLRYEADRTDLQFSLGMKNADMNNLLLELESCRDALTDYRNYAVIRSPADGVVISLDVEKGKFINENTAMVSVGVGSVFFIDCPVSKDNNFVTSGDTVQLSNTSHVLTGTVSRITPNAGGKTARIIVDSAELSAGETFEVQFEKRSFTLFTLVPNAALHQDNDGYFVYQIKRRKGILGEEYYVDRLNVYTGDGDYQNTVIIRGITFFEPLASVSDKPLTAGDRIFLKNLGDFFEN